MPVISPVEDISTFEYILSFDYSTLFPPDTDNQARKTCWDTERLRHPCCRTSADRRERSRQRQRLPCRKLLTIRKIETQTLSWSCWLFSAVQIKFKWVQSADYFRFRNHFLSWCMCILKAQITLNYQFYTSVLGIVLQSLISYVSSISRPVRYHCRSLMFYKVNI